MYEVIANDNKIIAVVPDEFIRSAYRAGYLRKATFETGEKGFKVQEPMKAGPIQGMYLFLQMDYTVLPCGLEHSL